MRKPPQPRLNRFNPALDPPDKVNKRQHVSIEKPAPNHPTEGLGDRSNARN
jgi:hypothetical protein